MYLWGWVMLPVLQMNHQLVGAKGKRWHNQCHAPLQEQLMFQKDRRHGHPQELLVPLLCLLLGLHEDKTGCRPWVSPIDAVTELISPPFQGPGVTIVMNHQRDVLVTKSTR